MRFLAFIGTATVVGFATLFGAFALLYALGFGEPSEVWGGVIGVCCGVAGLLAGLIVLGWIEEA